MRVKLGVSGGHHIPGVQLGYHRCRTLCLTPSHLYPFKNRCIIETSVVGRVLLCIEGCRYVQQGIEMPHPSCQDTVTIQVCCSSAVSYRIQIILNRTVQRFHSILKMWMNLSRLVQIPVVLHYSEFLLLNPKQRTTFLKNS